MSDKNDNYFTVPGSKHVWILDWHEYMMDGRSNHEIEESLEKEKSKKQLSLKEYAAQDAARERSGKEVSPPSIGLKISDTDAAKKAPPIPVKSQLVQNETLEHAGSWTHYKFQNKYLAPQSVSASIYFGDRLAYKLFDLKNRIEFQYVGNFGITEPVIPQPVEGKFNYETGELAIRWHGIPTWPHRVVADYEFDFCREPNQ